MTPAECLYESVRDRLPQGMTQAEYTALLGEWTLTPLYERGDLIGAVMTRENEIHVGYVRQALCMRGHIRATLARIIDRFGSAVTSVSAGNEKGLHFCRRLGFEPMSAKDAMVYMRGVRCKYA